MKKIFILFLVIFYSTAYSIENASVKVKIGEKGIKTKTVKEDPKKKSEEKKENDKDKAEEKITKFDDKLTVKLFFNYATSSFSILGYKNTEDENVWYEPNSSVNPGIALAYGGYGIAYTGKGTTEDEKKYGKTTYNDYQIYYYNKRIGVDLFYQAYKGMYLDYPEDYGYAVGDPETKRRDILMYGAGVNFYYIFSDDFSFAAAFDQTERQNNWGWTFMMMASPQYFLVHGNHSLIPSPPGYTNEFIGEFQDYKGGQYAILSVSPGIGFTIPYNNFFLSAALFYGLGYGKCQIFRESGNVHGNRLYQKLNWKISAGYNGDSWLAGMIVFMDSMSDMGDWSYSGPILQNYVMTINFFAGTRFSFWK